MHNRGTCHCGGDVRLPRTKHGAATHIDVHRRFSLGRLQQFQELIVWARWTRVSVWYVGATCCADKNGIRR